MELGVVFLRPGEVGREDLAPAVFDVGEVGRRQRDGCRHGNGRVPPFGGFAGFPIEIFQDPLGLPLGENLAELLGRNRVEVWSGGQTQAPVRQTPQTLAPVAAGTGIFDEPVSGQLAQVERAAADVNDFFGFSAGSSRFSA